VICAAIGYPTWTTPGSIVEFRVHDTAREVRPDDARHDSRAVRLERADDETDRAVWHRLRDLEREGHAVDVLEGDEPRTLVLGGHTPRHAEPSRGERRDPDRDRGLPTRDGLPRLRVDHHADVRREPDQRHGDAVRVRDEDRPSEAADGVLHDALEVRGGLLPQVHRGTTEPTRTCIANAAAPP
jgi:hypothetical protein